MIRDDPARAIREPSAGGKRLVVVVHGLGDSTPGRTVEPLASALAAVGGRSRVPADEVLWLPEGSGRQIESFACHVERLEGDGRQTVLAETCWSDLSRVGHGMLALLLGLCRLLLDLHEVVARQATDPARGQGRGREPAAWCFHWLSRGIAYVLRGPVVAAMLLWALYAAINGIWVLAGGSWELAVGSSSPGGGQAGVIRGLSLTTNLIATAVGIVGFRWRRGRTHRALFLWLALFGSMWLAFWSSSPWHPQPWSSSWSSIAGLGESWVVSFRQAQLPLMVASLLILLAVVPWLIARLRAERRYRPGLDAAQAINYVTFGAWLLLVDVLMLLVVQKLPAETIPANAGELTRRIANGLAFNAMVALILALVLVVILGRLWRWSRKNRAASYRPSHPAPRLILGPAFVYSVICMPIVLVTANVLVPEQMKALLELLEAPSRIIPPAVALIALVAIYLSEGLHLIIDFLLDFVSHFERRRSEADGKLTFVRRQRIRDRLRIVLETLVRREGPDRVTILAHSQGTVVALETLAEAGAGELLGRLGRCDLVTMGSPFHHIYQHYFPSDYPPLSDERWQRLGERIDRWVNIFRIDDFMGTAIEPGGEWPENLPVDPQGHTDYWIDRQVLRILEDRQLV